MFCKIKFYTFCRIVLIVLKFIELGKPGSIIVNGKSFLHNNLSAFSSFAHVILMLQSIILPTFPLFIPINLNKCIKLFRICPETSNQDHFWLLILILNPWHKSFQSEPIYKYTYVNSHNIYALRMIKPSFIQQHNIKPRIFTSISGNRMIQKLLF